MGGSGLVVSNRGVGDPMIKAFARLILWLAIALVLATAVLVWAFLPRHIPEAVAWPLGKRLRLYVPLRTVVRTS